MRIAYLVNTYPRPSLSFIRREIQALERRGIEIHRFALRDERQGLVDPGDIAEGKATEYVLSRGGPRLAASLLAAAVRSPRATLAAFGLALRTGIGGERGPLHHLIYLLEASYVAERCRALDVAHLHAHFGTNSATVAMLASALGGPGYSFTVHGPEEFDRPERLRLGEKIRRAAFTVGVSAFGRSQLCRWADLGDWPRLQVVPCGIEPAQFADHVAMPDCRETRLVTIGRFVEQKGQLLLVEAFARAAADSPGLRLALVGDGELRGQIEAAIAAHGLADRVRLTGWLDEAGVKAEIDRAHALVMPSFAEGLPMVIMEAMAAGRPVVSTFIAGIPELVQPGRHGWLVPAGDVPALADAMGAVAATSRGDLAAMGLAARERALERHDIDRSAATLDQLFRDSLTIHQL